MAGSVFITDGGELRIEASRPFGRRWLVTFAGVARHRRRPRTCATASLRAEPLDDPDALWVHELVGSEVIATEGRPLGTVTAVVANPASDLLELDDGVLVPLRFVVEHRPGRIVVDVPPGLLD